MRGPTRQQKVPPQFCQELRRRRRRRRQRQRQGSESPLWSCFFFVLSSSSFAAALSSWNGSEPTVSWPTAAAQQEQPLPHRWLQQSDFLLDDSCDFVDRERLQALIQGPDDFLQLLFPSLDRTVNEARRDLQQQQTQPTALSRQVALTVASLKSTKRTQNVVIRWNTANIFSHRRFVLRRVKMVLDKRLTTTPATTARVAGDDGPAQKDTAAAAAVTPQKEKRVIFPMVTSPTRQSSSLGSSAATASVHWIDSSPWIMEGFVVERNATRVQTFVRRSGFTVTPVHGKARGQSYHAMIVSRGSNGHRGSGGSRDRDLFHGKPDDETMEPQNLFDNVFFYVDQQSLVKQMDRDVRQILSSSSSSSSSSQRQLLSCPSNNNNNSNNTNKKTTKCLARVRRIFRQSKTQLRRETVEVPVQNTQREMHQWGVRRWHQLAGLAASCATSLFSSSEEEWNARPLQECLLNQVPVFYERHLSAYGTALHAIRVQHAAYQSRLTQLQQERDANYQACCGEAVQQQQDEERETRLRRHLQPATVSFSKRLAKREQTPLPFASSLLPGEAHAHGRRMTPHRTLQESTCLFFFDDAGLDDILAFPLDLFRTLTPSQQEEESSESVPPDVYVTRGYQPSVSSAQTLRFRRGGFTIVATEFPLQVDIDQLSEAATTSKSVKRFIRQTNRAGGVFSATVVQGESEPDEGTVISMVGILFGRSDKRKQLFWPVEDFSGFLLQGEEKFLQRRRRQRQLQGREMDTGRTPLVRQLQDADDSEFCEEGKRANDVCVAQAQDVLDQGVAQVNQNYRTLIAPLLDELAVVERNRLQSYVLACADCAARYFPEWEVDKMYLCVQDEKSPEIVQTYWWNVRPLLNQLAQAQAQRQALLVELERQYRQTLRTECCILLQQPQVDSEPPPPETPGKSPLTPSASTPSPTNRPTAGPTTVAPTFPPTTVPPTAIPTTKSPTNAPSLVPTPIPGNPTVAPVTKNPSMKPSLFPTKNPSREPSLFPTRNPSDKPSLFSTRNPSRQPTLVPMMGPSRSPTSADPTVEPSPTKEPSANPTVAPSVPPTHEPSSLPSVPPTHEPSSVPSKAPTHLPTTRPSPLPTPIPGNPTKSPVTSSPTFNPTIGPSAPPTRGPTNPPSMVPTRSPTVQPLDAPTLAPSPAPTDGPTVPPSAVPTDGPTLPPSAAPTDGPTLPPSPAPTDGPTLPPPPAPTDGPTLPPSAVPTVGPTVAPSLLPTKDPTSLPSAGPTLPPSNGPTDAPSHAPSTAPSPAPTVSPSKPPTLAPSLNPTVSPTEAPSSVSPTSVPTTVSPTFGPTMTVCPGETIISFDGPRFDTDGLPNFFQLETITNNTALEGVTAIPGAGTNAGLFNTVSPGISHDFGNFPQFGFILANRDPSNTDVFFPLSGGSYTFIFDQEVTLLSFDYIGERGDGAPETLGEATLLDDSGTTLLPSPVSFSTSQMNTVQGTETFGVSNVKELRISIENTSTVALDNIHFCRTWTAVPRA